MAEVHNKPRCRRCREFRPTVPVRVSTGVVQMCHKCQLAVGWTGEHVPGVETVTCEACSGSGQSSLGGNCVKCGGRGKRTVAKFKGD